MVLAGTTETDRFRDPQTAPGIKGDWAAVPAPKWGPDQPDTSRAAALDLDGYAINRFIDDKTKAAAMLFLDFMRSHEASLRELTDESNEAALLTVHDLPAAKKIAFPDARRLAVANSVVEPLPSAGRAVTGLVGEYFARAAGGSLGVTQALEELQARLDEYAVPEK